MASTLLVVEDGTGKTNSNSYVTVAELAAFVSDRGATLGGEHGDATEVLYKAIDALEALDYAGLKVSSTQALQWPRSGVYADGFLLASDEIPVALKRAQMALALAIDEGYDPLQNSDGTVVREKIDVLEFEYLGGGDPITRRYLTYLRKLMAEGSGANNFKVGS